MKVIRQVLRGKGFSKNCVIGCLLASASPLPRHTRGCSWLSMTGVVVGYQSGLGYYSAASKHFCVPLLRQAPLCANSEGPLLSSEAHRCLKGMGLFALRDISMLMRPFCKILPCQENGCSCKILQ